jgi:hypothetical protein
LYNETMLKDELEKQLKEINKFPESCRELK